MWAVLCHGGDQSALWAFEQLRHRRPVDLVLVEQMETPPSVWCYRHIDGSAGLTVSLADGRTLASGDHAAVLNRVGQPPAAALLRAEPADAAYALSELSAFALSWLSVIAGTVVNPPTPQGLAGRWRTPLHWRLLASRAGLPVEPLSLSSDDAATDSADTGGTTVLTIGGELLHACAPRPVRTAARRFAAAADTPILGLRFAGADPARAGWRLRDATPYPDLTLAGSAGISALERVLTR